MRIMAAGLTALYASQIGLIASGGHLNEFESISYLSQLMVWVWVALVWRRRAGS